MVRRRKIINIMEHPPAYRLFARDSRPDISWDTSGGSWVGIWGEDWCHSLGRKIIALTNEFEYEIWQPDIRADRIYSHTFRDGLIHRTFPAIFRKHLHGIKLMKDIWPSQMIRALRQYSKGEAILHLNGNFNSMNKAILRNAQKIPMLFNFHGEINIDTVGMHELKVNILSSANRFFRNAWFKNHINEVAYIVYQTDKNVSDLKKIYKGRMKKITSGCDFSFWKKMNKYMCRSELQLPRDKFVLITVASFCVRKQIDKFINVLREIMDRYDFLYIVVGHGTEKYEGYLREIAEPLLREKRIQFPGYLKGEKLLRYLNSADLFVSTSHSEGGPKTIMEAFACELPVFSTTTGNVAEVMREKEVGCLVDVYDYTDWKKKLASILRREIVPKTLNRSVAEQFYDWVNIAEKFLSVYAEL